MACEIEHILFKNGLIDVVGDLRHPNGFNANEKYAAIVIVTPGSSVKEQIGGFYGEKLARTGFITLAFDPSYQGQSGGSPRDLEDPASRVEDVRCAVDFLSTLPYVGEDRIGILGICAGGGYAVYAAMTEHRIKAVGTVVAVNLGRAFRENSGSTGSVVKAIEAVGEQRTIEARGGSLRRDPWIPDSPEQARAGGITDREILEAVDYYRTPRGYNEYSTNRRVLRGDAAVLGWDAFHLVNELLTQPIQVIVASRPGSTGSFDDGRLLWERALNKMDFFAIDGAGHYDMYDRSHYVDQAVERLRKFYGDYLVGKNLTGLEM